MNIAIIVVLVAALIGWVFVKNDEMSGLGRNAKLGSPRHPHGKLENVVLTSDAPVSQPFGRRFASAFPWIASCVVLAASVAFGLFDIPGNDAVMRFATSGMPALIICAESTLRAPEGKKTFWTYVYALVAAVACALIAWALFSVGFMPFLSPAMQTVAYAIVTTMFFALGSALCVALLPVKATFERTFEDGAKRSITVSTRSAAYAAFAAMIDETSKED